MRTNHELVLYTGTGRLRGFHNIFQKENRNWWTGRWLLLRIGIWVLLLDGLLAATLFILPQLTGPEGEPLIPGDPLQMGSEMFAGIATLALTVGIIVAMQDTVIQEKQTDTAAWVLSKPVSRVAFILAKLVANIGGMIGVMLLMPGLIAYGLFWLYAPGAIAFPNFLNMMAVVGLHTLFYLILALLLGVLTNSRGILLAVTLGSLLGGGLVPVQALVQISPWQLTQVALLFLQGQPVGRLEITMIIATIGWCLLFTALAVWQFQRLEF